MLDRKLLINLRLNSNKTHHFAIPSIIVSSFSLLKKVAIVGLLLFVAQMGSLAYHQIHLHQLVKIKISNIDKTKLLNAELDGYIKTVAQLSHDDNSLREKYNFKTIDPEIRLLGIGGPVDHDSAMINLTFPALKLNNSVHSKMSYLERQAEVQVENFQELQKHLERKIDSWRYIPSIRPTYGRNASSFGMRIHPVTNEYRLHEGMDIANKPWTPIISPADGVIKRSRVGKYFGNYIVIDHGNGIESVYGHLNKSDVKEGQFISRGKVLGYMGKTGRTTGTHLHYEIHKNGRPLNPERYIHPKEYSVD